jgi:hypothetical protein
MSASLSYLPDKAKSDTVYAAVPLTILVGGVSLSANYR